MLLKELVNQILDQKYQIEKVLGQGGMGAVYLATHLGTKRQVALKVIAPKFMANQEFVERFKREAEAAGRLRHPNVVNVTDFGFADVHEKKVAYLVMEYLDGYTLGTFLKKHSELSLQFTADIMEQVCLAVDKAHSLGIIHRDLKPDNIWLEARGYGEYHVKVLDFGLAKLRGSQVPKSISLDKSSKSTAIDTTQVKAPQIQSQTLIDTGALTQNLVYEKVSVAEEENQNLEVTQIQPEIDLHAATEESSIDGEMTEIVPRTSETEINPSLLETTVDHITQAGSVLGTPLYMSPEQCESKTLDARADVYSVGVIVYQMLTGKLPFEGSSWNIIMQHLQKSPTPIRKKRKNVPKAIDHLVLSALDKDPDKRPATARAFAAHFKTIIEGEEVILEQANVIYRKYRFAFWLVSFFIYLPIVIIGNIVTFINGYYFWVLLPLLLFGNSLNKVSCTVILNYIVQEKYYLKNVFFTLLKHFFPLLRTAISNSYFILLDTVRHVFIGGVTTYFRHSLHPQISFLEKQHGRKALKRSFSLAKILPQVSSALELYGLLLALIALAMVGLVGFDKTERSLLLSFNVWWILGMIRLLIPIVICMGYSRYAIASVLLCFRMKEVNGEQMAKESNIAALLSKFTPEYQPLHRRTLVFITTLVINEFLRILGLGIIFLIGFILAIFATDKTGIISAAQEGRENKVREILASGVDPNSTDFVGRTALLVAAEDGHLAMVKLLLEKGAKPNMANRDGDTPLIKSASQGYLRVAQALLEKGAKVDLKDHKKETALFHAVEKGRFEIVRLLLKKGANINHRNNKKTMLIWAAKKGRLQMVKLLVTKGANVDLKDHEGKTALEVAQSKGHKNIIKFLKQKTGQKTSK